MSRPSPEWVVALREAVRRGTRSGTCEVLRGAQPSLLAADAAHAFTSALMAALVVSAAVLRSDLARGTSDIIALLLRTAALVFVLRALLALLSWLGRIVKNRRASRWALAWSEHGVLLQTPEREDWAPRADVLGCAVADARAPRRMLADLAPLHLVLRARGAPAYWTLPPYFSANSELLRARIERWLEASPAVRDDAPACEADATSSAPSARYERAARGTPDPRDVLVPEGRGYVRRAPYGSLAALVFVVDALVQAGSERARLMPPALTAAALVVVTLGAWFAWMRRRAAPRLGVAMVLAPRELLVRGKHGVVALGYDELIDVQVSTQLAWSLLWGSYAVHTLTLDARDGTRLRFDQDFLGVPAGVLARLIERYRADASAAASVAGSPDADVPASQGSGGGGGSSARAGTAATATTST